MPPPERRRINVEVTRWLNECLGLNLTDAFCGFKAYRASALEKFDITDDGYAMPLQVWVQAVEHGMTIVEVPVPLDLPRRVAGLRRGARRRDVPAQPLPGGLPRGDGACRAGGGRGLSSDAGPQPPGTQRPTARCWRSPRSTGPAPLLAANAERLDAWDHDFQGRGRSAPRAGPAPGARRSPGATTRRPASTCPSSPRPGPLVVTGHQPELFHPGVWVKNFAVAGIAAKAGRASALNLIVDNDIPKGAVDPRPAPRGRRPPDVGRVAFDDWAGEVPFEDLPIRDEALFASFPDRVREALDGLVDRPARRRLLAPRHGRSRGHAGRDRVGRRFARARRAVEAEWGVQNLEVPLGELCETDAFLWFASHLLAQLPRFQAVHDGALARYRAAVQDPEQAPPRPALGRQGDWLEAPSGPGERPSRGAARCWPASSPGRWSCGSAARTDPFLEIPLAPDREACCAVEALRDLPGRGIRLRTRALTTTMFARLFLGDLFVHGIGGAKYDELGDEIVRGFFRLEPPAFLTLS